MTALSYNIAVSLRCTWLRGPAPDVGGDFMVRRVVRQVSVYVGECVVYAPPS